ncbi:polysaccharide pyruvyl transferase family protein [Neptunomonas phycophila]|uniref:Polysaccharide pyruvyl transferase family protein n=1 Tax=Neptunomonas phycophila TaxID=1572645 RepID=A0AAW7XMQ3_9GAMM|nr:polysaccharide pyruvyl transferase family protein [Neptunomonas phycophila]MDO6454344.1 polysaccharide pyruvyl transferase family protein [Neptunomonas phycophila]
MSDFDILENLSSKVSNISQFIKYKNVIYLDYPVHSNGGDLFIFKGVEKFFKDNGFNVIAAFTVHDYDPKKIESLLQNKKCSLVLHGGGNFGDIYEHHRKLRNSIFDNFTNENIVLLPQTSFYQNQHNLDFDCSKISRLTDAVFFSRDLKTLDIFKSFGVKSYLYPDMAHTLYEGLNEKPISNNTLYFIRRDVEKTDVALPLNIITFDWNDLFYKRDQVVTRFIVNVQKRFGFHKFTYVLWSLYTNILFDRYKSFFNEYDMVVTSRLHGHIFSSILGIPNRVIDNSYGKNSSYIEAWTSNLSYVEEFSNKE